MSAVCHSSNDSVGRRRSATAEAGETSVSGAKSLVSQAVDREIEVGVQVRQHGRVEVNWQRQTVGAVVQQHDDVRAPAAEERNEDDEHHFHLPYCLHCRDITGIGCLL